MQIRELENMEKNIINDIVSVHLATFQGFFLTFMGRGFLYQMYRSYCDHADSGLLVAFEDEKPVGFLAYSYNMNGLYKFMIRKRLIPFAWYSLGAFLRKPKIFMRIVRAFLKPSETKRKEEYVVLASIGVSPGVKSKGIGSKLIERLKSQVDFNKYEYITLETDAINNDGVNYFYQKNGFVLEKKFETPYGRVMNEYRFTGEICKIN